MALDQGAMLDEAGPIFLFNVGLFVTLGHKKLIFCFSGTFLKKRMRGGAIFFYCARLFFSCFSVDSNVKDCVIA